MNNLNTPRSFRIAAVIQARMGSSRLPGKVLQEVVPKRTLLDLTVENILDSGCLSDIIIATTDREEDHAIVEYANRRRLAVFRGDEHNVLNRFLRTAECHSLDACVRVCADNPLLDPMLLEKLVVEFEIHRPDYAGYVMRDGTPAICRAAGVFAECVSVRALRQFDESHPKLDIAQHVTLGIYGDPQRHLLLVARP